MNHNELPGELKQLFASYRDALPDRDGGFGFVPSLWNRIEQRRGVGYNLRRLASRVVTAAAALSLVLSVALWAPSQFGTATNSNYVEVLESDGPEAEVLLAADIR
jgi:hypothetical protein